MQPRQYVYFGFDGDYSAPKFQWWNKIFKTLPAFYSYQLPFKGVVSRNVETIFCVSFDRS
jgi:hypothetical protein